MAVYTILLLVAAAGLGAPSPSQQKLVVQDGRERFAQYKSDKSVPGALPGRSESSGETGPSTRAVRKKSKKSSGEEKGSKKDVPATGRKKDPQ